MHVKPDGDCACLGQDFVSPSIRRSSFFVAREKQVDSVFALLIETVQFLAHLCMAFRLPCILQTPVEVYSSLWDTFPELDQVAYM